MLDHAEPVRERDASRQRPRERAERRAVVALDDQQVRAVAALGLGVEAQLAAVLAGHPSQVGAEAHRRHLVRLAVDPHGALGARRRIVDAADEVPRHRPAVGALPDAGRPPPLGVARVIAGRVVDHRACPHLRRRSPPSTRERAARGDAGLLARPHLAAAVRAVRAQARFFVERSRRARRRASLDPQPPRLAIARA